MIRHIEFRAVFAVFLAQLALLPILGCAGVPFLATTPEVPDILRQLVDNPDVFDSSTTEALHDVAPGDVVDDLHGLSGCWGIVVTPRDAKRPITVYQVYQFVPEAHAFTNWLFFRDSQGVSGFVFVETGTYQVLDESRISLSREKTWATDPFSGDLVEIPASSLSRTALVTLRGEYMMLFDHTENPMDISDREQPPVFRRFDCVE